MNKITLEAYSLEELCNQFNIDLGSQYYDYLIDDILLCEMSGSSQGMEYSLIYLDKIIGAMTDRFKNYEKNELEDFESDLLNAFVDFMKNKDEQTLVYIHGW